MKGNSKKLVYPPVAPHDVFICDTLSDLDTDRARRQRRGIRHPDMALEHARCIATSQHRAFSGIIHDMPGGGCFAELLNIQNSTKSYIVFRPENQR